MHQEPVREDGGQERGEQREGKDHAQDAVSVSDAQAERTQELTRELAELERGCAEARQRRTSIIAETEAVRLEYETAWRILRKMQSKIDTQQALPAPIPSPAPRVMRDVGVDACVACAAASSNTEREWVADALPTSQAAAGDTEILSVARSSVRVSLRLPHVEGDTRPPHASMPPGLRPAAPCASSLAAPPSTGRDRYVTVESAVLVLAVARAARARERELLRWACDEWQACVALGRVRRRSGARWTRQRQSWLLASWRRALETRHRLDAVCLQVPHPFHSLPRCRVPLLCGGGVLPRPGRAGCPRRHTCMLQGPDGRVRAGGLAPASLRPFAALGMLARRAVCEIVGGIVACLGVCALPTSAARSEPRAFACVSLACAIEMAPTGAVISRCRQALLARGTEAHGGCSSPRAVPAGSDAFSRRCILTVWLGAAGRGASARAAQ